MSHNLFCTGHLHHMLRLTLSMHKTRTAVEVTHCLNGPLWRPVDNDWRKSHFCVPYDANFVSVPHDANLVSVPYDANFVSVLYNIKRACTYPIKTKSPKNTKPTIWRINFRRKCHQYTINWEAASLVYMIIFIVPLPAYTCNGFDFGRFKCHKVNDGRLTRSRQKGKSDHWS